MFQEVVELVQFAEELGFDAVAFPEHHLHSEGFEMGAPPEFLLYVALHTKRIQVGPIGYVLPGWDPLRLAVTTAWLDQLTHGRSFFQKMNSNIRAGKNVFLLMNGQLNA